MDEQVPPSFFGEWLRQRRRALDLTQAELAERAGCSVFALRKIESGERRPSKQLAQLLAASLHVPPEDRDAFVRAARGETTVGRLRPAVPDSDARRVPAPPPSDELAPLHSLPVTLTRFVGREPELAALCRLMHDPLCRLITLIGAGGIGKTRLAIEAASRNWNTFTDGVCFVSLASLRASEFIVPAIADALGLGFQGHAEPRAQLLNHLSGKHLLLVMDNAEHLLDGVGLYADILQRAPAVKLLVTSRERLNVQSEWVFVVQGLPVPPPDGDWRVQDYTAAELFIQSARRVRSEFELRGEDQAALARICQLVEGMPLGIELAATWVPMLTCHEIACRIERSLDFLTTTMRDVPDRQRSLRAVFDHSWRLLTAEERGVLSRLAVFHGSFGLEAAEQIAGATLPILLAMVSKSLVRRRESGHFDLHEVVRQYALSYLVSDPSGDTTRQRHSQYYLSLLHDRESALQGAALPQTIRELKDDIDNIRAAWNWAVEHEAFALIGHALRSFGWLCTMGVLYQEGVEQIQLAVQTLRARPEDEARRTVLGQALAQQGLLLFRQGRFDLALPVLEESLSILRLVGDPSLLPGPLVIAGVIMHLIGDLDQAQSLMEEGLTAARTSGDRLYTAYALYNLGYLASLMGRYNEGYEQMMDGLDMWRQHGDPSSIGLGLNYISPTLIHLGHIEEAKGCLHESLAMLTQVGERWGMGTAHRFLGLAALAQGNLDEAQAHIRRSLDLFEGFISGWDIAKSLIYLSEVTSMAGDADGARHMLCEAVRVALEAHTTPLILEAFVGLARLHIEAGEAEVALILATAAADHRSSTYDTSQRARRLSDEAEALLTAQQAGTAREKAVTHSLEALVDIVLAGGCRQPGEHT